MKNSYVIPRLMCFWSSSLGAIVNRVEPRWPCLFSSCSPCAFPLTKCSSKECRVEAYRKFPSAQIRDLATCGFIERRESLLLVGPVGVGKTHLAQAIGHAACLQGKSVLFEKTTRLLADLGAGHLDATWERRLRRYLVPDLLICDDFGLRAFTERQGEDLYELVSERVRRGSTIVTSNRPPTEWYALFPNAVLAEGALDRLINAAHHITLQGKSYRPQRRPDRTKEVTPPKKD